MRARLWAGVVCAGLAGAALAQTPSPALASYAIDPSHTFVHWEVVHLGTSTIRGRFDRVRGNIGFDARTRQIDVGVSVDIASVSSGVPVLDGLLRGAEMLDAAAFPQAYFTARGATFEADVPREIRGEFTLHGVSQPLTLHATRWRCGLNPLFLREVCGGDFEATFERSAFGVRHSVPFVSDQVRLLVQIEAVHE